MTLEDMLAPTYSQMLNALSAWLEKAEVQMADKGTVLCAARLAPDMFPLATQVRFACVQALEGTFRLQGKPFPDAVATLLDEGRAAGAGTGAGTGVGTGAGAGAGAGADAPHGTLAGARARIAETLAAVAAAAPDDTGASAGIDPATPIAHALPMGLIFDLTAAQYVRDWALPQFYFHLMAAYAILRAQGVDLGKADFVAHMFAYARPGTLPAA